MKTNGIMINRHIFEESCKAERMIFDDLTTGVLLYLIKKKTVIAVQLSKRPETDSIKTPVRSVKRKVRLLYVS